MMSFEDLKERLSDTLKPAWEQFQESAPYQQARDRYENLTPVVQKLVVVGGALLGVLILLSIPWGTFSTSSDSIVKFEERRTLIRDLLKVSREANESPDIPLPPDMISLKSRIESSLQAAQLLPEQIKSIEASSEASVLIPSAIAAGALRVQLSQLNLRQVIDLGYQIQAISPSVKVLDMEMIANSLKPKYFDVVYKLVALNVPQPPAVAPAETDDGNKEGTKANSRKSKAPSPRSRGSQNADVEKTESP